MKYSKFFAKFMQVVSKIKRTMRTIWTFTIEPYNYHKFSSKRTKWLAESDKLFYLTMDLLNNFTTVKEPKLKVFLEWYNNQIWNDSPYAVLQDKLSLGCMITVDDMEVSERRSALLLASYIEDELNEAAYRVAISHITEESMKHILAWS
jgi:hypothetical protein